MMRQTVSGWRTYWCSVLAVLVSNLLDCRVTHEVGGVCTPVLLGRAVWGTQGRVCSQVNALQWHRRSVTACHLQTIYQKHTKHTQSHKVATSAAGYHMHMRGSQRTCMLAWLHVVCYADQSNN